MVVSSTLVNVSDDAEVRLVTLLAEAAPPQLLGVNFQAECQKSIQAGNAGALLDTVLKDAGAIAALLTLEPTEEATAAFSLLSALVERAGRPVNQLSDAIIQAKNIPNKETRKICLLSVLYNMRSLPKEKCVLLRQMIELAGASASSTSFLDPLSTLGKLLVDESSPSPISPGQPRLVTLLNSWKLPAEEQRDMFRTVANVMPVSDKRKQRFLLLMIHSFSSSAIVDAKALEAAKEAAIGAIRDPLSLFVHQRNMLVSPAVQALSKDNSTLLNLLKVFQEGKLSDYQAFIKANGGSDKVLKQWELDADSCTRNIRILSLCSLASEHEEIPYSIIAETLQLPPEDTTQVESWVIAAVSSGLLQAKMDQLAHTVMVERSVVRRFDMEQWKALQSQLFKWKLNVANVLAGFKESQTALRQS